MTLEEIIAHGNRGHHYPIRDHKSIEDRKGNWIDCADGFRMSVIAGGGTYCEPHPVLCACGLGADLSPLEPGAGDVVHDYPGPYTAVEVGFPSQRPEPWSEWRRHAESPDEPTDTVYGAVPVETVRALVALHGGEAVDETGPMGESGSDRAQGMQEEGR